MKNVKEMTCISCPIGCRLTVDFSDLDDIRVTGNSCKRGITYGRNEILAPKRMVTTTVRLSGGGTLSVKTVPAAPKEEIFNILRRLKDVTVTAPIKTGDIILKNVCEGVDIVSTQDAPENT